MNPELTEVKNALNTLDLARARDLLRELLKQEPSADVYHLASLAALNKEQKRDFLQKALDLDPFHAEANRELANLQRTLVMEKERTSGEEKRQYAAEIGETERKISQLEAEIKGIDQQLAGMGNRKTGAGVLLVVSIFLVIAIIGLIGIIAAVVMFNNISKEEAQLQAERQKKQPQLDAARSRLAELKTLAGKA